MIVVRYSSGAPAIVYSTPSAKLCVLGVALFAVAACVYCIGLFVNTILAPIAIEPSTVMAFGGNLTSAAATLSLAGTMLFAGGITHYVMLSESTRLHARIRKGLFDPRYGNPLHLREGELLPDISCKETAPGQFELAISTSSSTAEEISKMGPSISSRLRGRFSRYAVVLAEADVACNQVTFFLGDVTLHREIKASRVEDLCPANAYEFRVQNGTSIDLRTSGSMLIAGKTTGVIALLLQALLAGPDGHGSQVLIIDPKQAEPSRLPRVVSLNADGDARAILSALSRFADSIKERQSFLNDRSTETGDAVHWWDAGLHVSLLFMDEYVALRTLFPKRASKEDPDYCLATFDGLVKRIVTMGASAGCYAIISIAEASVEEGGLPSMLRSACSTRVLFKPTLPEARLIWGAERLLDLGAPRTFSPGDAWFSSTDGAHDRIGFVHFPIMDFPVYRELGRLLDLYFRE